MAGVIDFLKTSCGLNSIGNLTYSKNRLHVKCLQQFVISRCIYVKLTLPYWCGEGFYYKPTFSLFLQLFFRWPLPEMHGSGRLWNAEVERLHQHKVLRRRHVQHFLKFDIRTWENDNVFDKVFLGKSLQPSDSCRLWLQVDTHVWIKGPLRKSQICSLRLPLTN